MTEPDPSRRELVEALGARAIDPAPGMRTDALAEIVGGPKDLVVDAVGTSASMADGLWCSRLGGRIVLVGMGSPRLELPAFSVSTGERSLIGSFGYTDEHFRDTALWVGTNPVGVDLLVQQRVTWGRAVDAFTALAKGESRASKVLVRP